MNRLDFLRISIERDWIFSMRWASFALGVCLQQPEADLQAEDGSVQVTPFGTGVIIGGKFEMISEVKPGEPVLSVKSPITVDSTLARNVKEPIASSVGLLLLNHYLSIKPLRGNVAYINSSKIVGMLDKIIASKLKATPKDPSLYVPGEIYVADLKEYQKYADWLRQFAPLVTVSATYRVMVEADGMKEFKAELAKKYAGKFHDPVEFVKYENELKAFDDAWRKGDPNYGGFGGKKVDVSRKKLYGVVGATLGFTDKDAEKRVYTGAIADGYSMDPASLVLMVNDARAASYSRGKETQDGGVGAKRTLAAINTYKFVDQDCGSRTGKPTSIRPDRVEMLVGRTLILPNGGLKRIENTAEAGDYLGKVVNVRSAIGCRMTGQTRCRVCVGERLFKVPEGISIPATEVTSEIITTSMKAMHGTILKLATIDLNVAFT